MALKYFITILTSLVVFSGCSNKTSNADDTQEKEKVRGLKPPYIQVLGITQDAGYPQAGCKKECCKGEVESKMVACLALVTNEGYYLFDATPDFTQQVALMDSKSPKGIFLTHGHIGHYTGLMYMGREAMGASAIPVYCMPRMQGFLANNGPWSQLVELDNIAIKPMDEESEVNIGYNISIQPFLVPHRDEFTETVGYRIEHKNWSLVYIPDIDKWSKWEIDLKQLIKQNDYVLIDGTFYDGNELPGRDMSEIPHPFVVETIDLLKDLPKEEKSKVYFIHLNHTNPLLNSNSKEYKEVKKAGFNIADESIQLQL